MRLAPVPLYFAGYPEEATEYCAQSSKTTHGAVECLDACRLLGALILGAVRKVSKEEMLSPFYHPCTGYWEKKTLTPKIAKIAAGSYKEKEPPDIKGSGYVVESLEAALWAFYKTDSFKEGALLGVNLGDDADTTGAVYGQLAGAFYGVDDIPIAWRDRISDYAVIEELAKKLYYKPKSIWIWKNRRSDIVLYDKCIDDSDKSFRLYLADTYDGYYIFRTEIVDVAGKILYRDSSGTPYYDNYYIKESLARIRRKYSELRKYIKEFYEVIGWKEIDFGRRIP